MGALFGTSVDTRSSTFAPLTDDAQILAQWVTLILDTQVGIYWSAPTAGASLRDYILLGLTSAQLQAIPSEVRAQLLQDERIASVDIGAPIETFTGGGDAAIQLNISIKAKGAEGLPFNLTAIASADVVKVILQGSGS